MRRLTQLSFTVWKGWTPGRGRNCPTEDRGFFSPWRNCILPPLGRQYLWGGNPLSWEMCSAFINPVWQKAWALSRMCTTEMVTVMFGGLRQPPNISRPSEPLPGGLCLTGKEAWGLSGPHSSSSAGSLSWGTPVHTRAIPFMPGQSVFLFLAVRCEIAWLLSLSWEDILGPPQQSRTNSPLDRSCVSAARAAFASKSTN